METSRADGWRRRAQRLRTAALVGAPLLMWTVAVPPAPAAGASPGVGPAVATDAAGPSGQVAVVAQFAPTVVAAGRVAAAALGRPVRAEPAGRYVAAVPAAQAAADVARLRAQPGVRYAEMAQLVHSTGGPVNPDDPCYVTGCTALVDGNPNYPTIAGQGYLATIGAPAAWAVSKGAGIKVAVLDTGVDLTHPDLQGPAVGSSYPYDKIVNETNVCATDLACGDAAPGDDNGHGTHVSGILAAITDNATGVASLGWDVDVDVYKVLDQNGNGNTADVDTAIYDAVAAGDRVINLSLANYSCQQDLSQCGPDPDEQAAVEYAIAHDVVVVAAAGNGLPGQPGDSGDTYPASYPGVLAVAATDNAGTVQSFSQWGGAANIAAPGTGIVSTWNDGGYAVLDGTSMSTPQVSAAAALLMAARPSLSAQQVVQILESTSRATAGGNPINGGLLDAGAALQSAETPSRYLGYDLAGGDGSVYSFGSVGAYGSLTGTHLTQPVVGEAVRPDGMGYWLVASDGGVFAFGDARFYGSTGGVALVRPIVGMAATPDGGGYWLVASDGGVFAFGDARFYGSTGGVALVRPIVGMAATPDGGGYWLVASDGGVFTFGDARFYGSTGSSTLPAPVVAVAS